MVESGTRTTHSFGSRCKRRVEDPSEDPMLYPCRKREKDPDDSIRSKLGYVFIEFLCRLPCRSAIQCMSVSKSWFSLISDPYFVRRFIHHRHQLSRSDSDSVPFTLLLQYKESQKNILVLPSDNSELFIDCGGGGGLDFLDFLPCFERARKNYPFCIVASFNDLLLVRSEVPPIRKPSFCEYCICNPLTKQWLTLPHLPCSRRNDMVGFVCDLCSCDKEQRCVTNAYYRYKVVLIHSPTETNTTQLSLQIFSSETGEWRGSVVSSQRGLNPFRMTSLDAGVLVCNGILYWIDADKYGLMIKGFVKFDPFNDAERCHYIDPPINLLPRDLMSFGVFQGHLRIFQIPGHHSPHDDGAYKFYVWELENYGTWCLKHKVNFKDTVSDHSDLVKIANGITPPGALLAFHPNVSEIVFLQLGNYIVLCNMQTRVLKVVSQLRDGGKILPGISCYYVSVYAKSVFLLTQPSWPTPVPPLPFH
nr:putative F-box/kelch-repeat protein At4g22430 [Quercus suber]POE73207.1 putative f-box/kelch-repeat protein [Quercus suber]